MLAIILLFIIINLPFYFLFFIKQKKPKNKLIFGHFIHAPKIGEIKILKNVVMEVEDGIIKNISSKDDFLDDSRFDTFERIYLTDSQFFIPGFVDLHTHAPQYINLGIGLDLPLLDWLKTYTFPQEKRFKDLKHAAYLYEKCVKRFLRNGTTTCCYYGTIHLEATILLADIIQKLGQRGLVGPVCMDQNSDLDYIESTNEGIEKTEKFILEVKNKSLVTPVVTPRFAPTCSFEMLKGLGQIAHKYNVPIQTHLSENLDEIKWVAELFPSCENYTDVYDQSGLLTNQTLLGHSIYLSQDEIDLIKKRESTIVHCPNSNFTINSGIAPIRKYLNDGLRVALGTDCSGGYSPSMLNAMRCASIASKSISFTSLKKEDILSMKEIFYLATLGGMFVFPFMEIIAKGAASIGLDKKIGSFEIGKEFDALLIDVNVENSPFDAFLEQESIYTSSLDTKLELMLQRFLCCGDERNICRVFVQGKQVVPF